MLPQAEPRSQPPPQHQPSMSVSPSSKPLKPSYGTGVPHDTDICIPTSHAASCPCSPSAVRMSGAVVPRSQFLLHLLGGSFFALFVGYFPVQSSLTTLFGPSGSIALALMYGMAAISNLVAPTLVRAIQPRLLLPVSSLGYVCFIAAAVSEQMWFLMLASIILGIANTSLWAAQGAVLTLLAPPGKRGATAATFLAYFRASLVVGNLLVGVMFSSTSLSDRTVCVIMLCVGCVGTALLLFLKYHIQAHPLVEHGTIPSITHTHTPSESNTNINTRIEPPTSQCPSPGRSCPPHCSPSVNVATNPTVCASPEPSVSIHLPTFHPERGADMTKDVHVDMGFIGDQPSQPSPCQPTETSVSQCDSHGTSLAHHCAACERSSGSCDPDLPSPAPQQAPQPPHPPPMSLYVRVTETLRMMKNPTIIPLIFIFVAWQGMGQGYFYSAFMVVVGKEWLGYVAACAGGSAILSNLCCGWFHDHVHPRHRTIPFHMAALVYLITCSLCAFVAYMDSQGTDHRSVLFVVPMFVAGICFGVAFGCTDNTLYVMLTALAQQKQKPEVVFCVKLLLEGIGFVISYVATGSAGVSPKSIRFPIAQGAAVLAAYGWAVTTITCIKPQTTTTPNNKHQQQNNTNTGQTKTTPTTT